MLKGSQSSTTSKTPVPSTIVLLPFKNRIVGSTFYSLHYHIVFSTKDRRAFIRLEWRDSFHRYMGGIIRGLGGIPESVGGVADHVHLLVSLKTTQDIASFVRESKKASSVWAIKNHDGDFEWQEGYAVFAVSYIHIDDVRAYINRQEEHHKKTGFAEEYKRLLERNGVAFEAKHLE